MENPFEIIIEMLNNIDRKLNNLEEKYFTLSNEERTSNDVYTVKQVAKFLQLSVPTIYGLVHRREIPHYKVNKRLYFKKPEIQEMIDKRKVKTTEEIKMDALSSLVTRRKK